jgi:hypothetical protein
MYARADVGARLIFVEPFCTRRVFARSDHANGRGRTAAKSSVAIEEPRASPSVLALRRKLADKSGKRLAEFELGPLTVEILAGLAMGHRAAAG